MSSDDESIQFVQEPSASRSASRVQHFDDASSVATDDASLCFNYEGSAVGSVAGSFLGAAGRSASGISGHGRTGSVGPQYQGTLSPPTAQRRSGSATSRASGRSPGAGGAASRSSSHAVAGSPQTAAPIPAAYAAVASAAVPSPGPGTPDRGGGARTGQPQSHIPIGLPPQAPEAAVLRGADGTVYEHVVSDDDEGGTTAARQIYEGLRDLQAGLQAQKKQQHDALKADPGAPKPAHKKKETPAAPPRRKPPLSVADILGETSSEDDGTAAPAARRGISAEMVESESDGEEGDEGPGRDALILTAKPRRRGADNSTTSSESMTTSPDDTRGEPSEAGELQHVPSISLQGPESDVLRRLVSSGNTSPASPQLHAEVEVPDVAPPPAAVPAEVEPAPAARRKADVPVPKATAKAAAQPKAKAAAKKKHMVEDSVAQDIAFATAAADAADAHRHAKMKSHSGKSKRAGTDVVQRQPQREAVEARGVMVSVPVRGEEDAHRVAGARREQAAARMTEYYKAFNRRERQRLADLRAAVEEEQLALKTYRGAEDEALLAMRAKYALPESDKALGYASTPTEATPTARATKTKRGRGYHAFYEEQHGRQYSTSPTRPRAAAASAGPSRDASSSPAAAGYGAQHQRRADHTAARAARHAKVPVTVAVGDVAASYAPSPQDRRPLSPSDAGRLLREMGQRHAAAQGPSSSPAAPAAVAAEERRSATGSTASSRPFHPASSRGSSSKDPTYAAKAAAQRTHSSGHGKAKSTGNPTISNDVGEGPRHEAEEVSAFVDYASVKEDLFGRGGQRPQVMSPPRSASRRAAARRAPVARHRAPSATAASSVVELVARHYKVLLPDEVLGAAERQQAHAWRGHGAETVVDAERPLFFSTGVMLTAPQREEFVRTVEALAHRGVTPLSFDKAALSDRLGARHDGRGDSFEPSAWAVAAGVVRRSRDPSGAAHQSKPHHGDTLVEAFAAAGGDRDPVHFTTAGPKRPGAVAAPPKRPKTRTGVLREMYQELEAVCFGPVTRERCRRAAEDLKLRLQQDPSAQAEAPPRYVTIAEMLAGYVLPLLLCTQATAWDFATFAQLVLRAAQGQPFILPPEHASPDELGHALQWYLAELAFPEDDAAAQTAGGG